MAKNFIGYGSLEERARSVDAARPVYASAITSPGQSNKHGIRIDTAEIVCSQPDVRGDVHYCLISVGQWQELIGTTDFGKRRRDEAIARQQSAWAIVKAWLAEQGFDTRDAIIAFPKSYRFLDGWANFLKWDKESGQFVRVEPEIVDLQPVEF